MCIDVSLLTRPPTNRNALLNNAYPPEHLVVVEAAAAATVAALPPVDDDRRVITIIIETIKIRVRQRRTNDTRHGYRARVRRLPILRGRLL